jgi:hypothetical protein
LPKACRPREKVKNHGRACTEVLFLGTQSWVFSLFRNSDRLAGAFRWSEDPSIAWLVPSTAEDPLAENRFFRQVRELKMQRKKAKKEIS